ncbi:MAG: hypothetical protein JSR58_03540 [Verrucomicrobia bacterium]|nr:hypothetical protein [Verrucomicrobiota bacterium]
MKKNILSAFVFLCCATMLLGQPPSTPTGDCSSMSGDIQAFAAKLSPSNKMMFCGKFNDAQRGSAMQMTGQMDSSGMVMMSPDQAVDKVAKDNNLTTPGKAPAGCPVKP